MATITTRAGPARRIEYSEDSAPDYRAVLAEDAPADLEKGIVYVVGPAAKPWFAAVTCPTCGKALFAELGGKVNRALSLAGNKLCLSPEMRCESCRTTFVIYAGKAVVR
jgi:tartrate dehydratase beta subunit/fumarate hydratase class I family protein